MTTREGSISPDSSISHPSSGCGLQGVAAGQILDVADEEDALVSNSLAGEQTDRRFQHERFLGKNL